eukprot:10143428-Alexandrium_andersonii.AAC.1
MVRAECVRIGGDVGWLLLDGVWWLVQDSGFMIFLFLYWALLAVNLLHVASKNVLYSHTADAAAV